MRTSPEIDVKPNETSTPAPSRSPEGHPVRRPYHHPRLAYFGDVRDLTMGGSGGNPESGGSFIPGP